MSAVSVYPSKGKRRIHHLTVDSWVEARNLAHDKAAAKGDVQGVKEGFVVVNGMDVYAIKVAKANPGNEDEDMGEEDDEDFDPKEEMRTGIVIKDRVRGGYDVSAEGRFVAHYDDWDKTIRAIAVQMEKEQYWPNVFFVNDHGNVDWLNIQYKSNKGRVFGKVTSKIIRSWV